MNTEGGALVADMMKMAEMVALYAQLAKEYGARGAADIKKDVEKMLAKAVEALKNAETDPALKANEPDDYARILKARPKWIGRAHV